MSSSRRRRRGAGAEPRVALTWRRMEPPLPPLTNPLPPVPKEGLWSGVRTEARPRSRAYVAPAALETRSAVLLEAAREDTEGGGENSNIDNTTHITKYRLYMLTMHSDRTNIGSKIVIETQIKRLL